MAVSEDVLPAKRRVASEPQTTATHTGRLQAVPTWAWLVAIVALSFLVRAWLSREMVAPFIMVDELIYSELARSFAESGHFAVRDVATSGYSVVYPVVIAPAYALFQDLVNAYDAVKVVNAFAMSLAAIPAYLLARRVVSPRLSLLAAVITVALPSLAYTGTVMTENVFFPLFLALAVSLVWLLEQPTPGRTALLLVLLVLAYETRVQALAIVPALLTAPLVLAALRRDLMGTLRQFRYVYAGAVALAVLGLAALTLTGRSFDELLGAYQVVGDTSYDTGDVLRFLLYHWAELVLYLGFVPVAATIVLAGRAHALDRNLQVYLAATLSLAFWLVLVAAAFASRFADRIQERNTFVVAPFFVVGLLAWVARGAPRPRFLAIGAATVTGATALLIPFDRFISTSAISDTLALLPWWSVQDRTGLEWVAELVFLFGLAAMAAFLLTPRRWAIALPLLVLAYYAVIFKPVWFGKHGVRQASIGALFQGIRGAERQWIDDVVPDGATVGALYTGRADRFTVNENEFFNRSLGPVYYVNGPTPGGEGTETRVTVDPQDGIVRDGNGRELPERYFLLDGTIDPDGKALVRDELGMTLWRLRGPLVSLSRVRGLYDDGWSGAHVAYRRLRCSGGSVVVSLSGDRTLFGDRKTTVVARSGGREVARVRLGQRDDQAVSMRVPLTPRRGRCLVRFDVAPTAVPSRVLAGSTDDRRLGTHVKAFAYEP